MSCCPRASDLSPCVLCILGRPISQMGKVTPREVEYRAEGVTAAWCQTCVSFWKLAAAGEMEVLPGVAWLVVSGLG